MISARRFQKPVRLRLLLRRYSNGAEAGGRRDRNGWMGGNLVKSKIWFRALALGVILSSGALGVSAASTYAKSGNRADSHSHAPFQHIFVIMME